MTYFIISRVSFTQEVSLINFSVSGGFIHQSIRVRGFKINNSIAEKESNEIFLTIMNMANTFAKSKRTRIIIDFSITLILDDSKNFKHQFSEFEMKM